MLARLLAPVLACAAMAGCYRSHGARGAVDAGRATDATLVPPSDVGPPRRRDGGPRDGGACRPVPLDFACTASGNGELPAGREHELPVYFGDGTRCYCGEELRCEARIEAPGLLSLATEECAEVLCDACWPFVRGTCRVPPLAEGLWRVRVDGADAFELRAWNGPAPGPTERCLTHPRDSLDCRRPWGRPAPEQTDQICHLAERPAGAPTAVRITDFCRSCGALEGPCEVVRAGTRIRVRPTLQASSCDVDCPSPCTLAEQTCFVPPLEPGTYVVELEGLPGSTELRVVPPDVGTGGRVTCNSLPED